MRRLHSSNTTAFRLLALLALCAVALCAQSAVALGQGCGGTEISFTISANPTFLGGPGETSTVTATVTRDSEPVQGDQIQFSVSGPGTISPITGTTNQDGQATTTFTATGRGSATVTATDLTRPALDPASCTITILKVDIAMGGQIITGTTRNTIVGKQISLVGTRNSGARPATHSWSIAGSPIKNYIANASEGRVVDLVAGDLSSSTVAFYWVTAGDGRQVTYTATVEGKSASATATFNVKRPTSTLTTVTGAVSINDSWGYRSMSFGIYGGTPGITFTRTFVEPAGFTGGTTQWVQVIDDRLHRRQKTSDGSWQRIESHNVCDTVYPYDGNYANTDDSPGTAAGDLSLTYSRRIASVSYTMYLMYKPSGTAIWVPLRKVSWGWYGDCHRTDALNNWTLDSNSHSVNPASSDCTAEPLWSGNSDDYGWQPE